MQEDQLLTRFIAQRQLPKEYQETARQCFLPLAGEIEVAVKAGRLQVLGIVGSQGSGKSTLAALLEIVLQDRGLRVASLSLDDFYLTRGEREELAARVHPLLMSRGVPGTHDVELAIRTIGDLLHRQGETLIPRFDKAIDDRRPASDWDRCPSPVDLVILEGWCLGAEAQSADELRRPINDLERNEDPDGRWREYANNCLRTVYPKLFRLIDKLVVLEAPDFDCVYQWRQHQEEQLRATPGNRIMSTAQLNRFIQHFERITRHSLRTLPQRGDVVFELNARQDVVRRYGRGI